jgi:hypothetical protein
MLKRGFSRALPIATSSTLAWAVACSSAGNPAQSTSAGADAATFAPIPPEDGPHSDAGHGYTRIDDMEGTAVPWTAPAGASARWLTSTDHAQYSSLFPAPCTPWSYAPVPIPYETFPGITSTHAARLRTVQPLGNGAFGATLGLPFGVQGDVADPRNCTPPDAGFRPLTPADLSAYKGITFWAKATQTPGTSTVYVQLEDNVTSPSGGVCVDSDGGTSKCFDGFGVTLNLTDTFTQYTIDFSALAQAGWGLPSVSGAPDLKQVYLLIFDVDMPSGASSLTFDLWIDDLYFVNK